ncbi:MAG: LemA family protein [Deltaproteobacteria bacterium]|nr:LemA family protein [Deltaproteobacteria bacterium]
MDTERIFRRLYPGAAKSRRTPNWIKTRVFRTLHWIKSRRWHLLLIATTITVWFFAHLYYYNMLVDLEYNIRETWAQVETQLQRRYHIQSNLTRIVSDYSNYEKDLLTQITKMRTGVRGEAPMRLPSVVAGSPAQTPATPIDQFTPRELDRIFSRIQVVAEQYPQLKLTENFQQFSQAIIDTENQIADQTMAYNSAVNDYTTVLKQFPGNVFGSICGFSDYDFYIPDRKKMDFKRVEY